MRMPYFYGSNHTVEKKKRRKDLTDSCGILLTHENCRNFCLANVLPLETNDIVLVLFLCVCLRKFSER